MRGVFDLHVSQSCFIWSRSAEDGDAMPDELVSPLALDDRLLDPSATTSLPSADQDNKDPEAPGTPPDANEAPSVSAWLMVQDFQLM